MASALRFDDPIEDAPAPRRATPTPVLSLPKNEPFVGRNRRFLPRVARHFAVYCDHTVTEGIDLSFRGMMCRAEEVVWPGNLLDFDLLLPDAPTPISVRGRVVEIVTHRGQLAMRIAFEEVNAHGRRHIALWMARTS